MPVHVSIHDVSPFWSDELEIALDLCASRGVRPALVVVPNFHGKAPLLDNGAFCSRIRGLQREGHEIYLHGFFHQSRRKYDVTLGTGHIAWLFAQHVASRGEAEMSDVSMDEGRARIEDGERVLLAAKLRVDGFVAPAWSMPPWLLPLLREHGYRFTEDHVRVYDPAGGRSRPSVVLNWATRSPVRVLSTVAWCRAAKYVRGVVPARIAIHPADMRYRLVRREIERILDWASGDIVARGTDLIGG
jgi:predicted deacetylase